MDRSRTPVAAARDAVTANALPGILGKIALETSTEIAIALARAFGGRRLYLPREGFLVPQHPLAKLVGMPAARVICARWGGERHDIPGARTYLRWYDARHLRRQGKSLAEISRELGIGINHVARLVRGVDRGAPARGAGGPGEVGGTPPAQNRFLTGSNGGYGASQRPAATTLPEKTPAASPAVSRAPLSKRPSGRGAA